jgi:hypothetical protein
VHHDTPETRATLALEAGGGDAPAGALLTDDGRRRAFRGWIELASAIEDWRQTCEADKPPDTGRRLT